MRYSIHQEVESELTGDFLEKYLENGGEVITKGGGTIVMVAWPTDEDGKMIRGGEYMELIEGSLLECIRDFRMYRGKARFGWPDYSIQ